MNKVETRDLISAIEAHGYSNATAYVVLAGILSAHVSDMTLSDILDRLLSEVKA